MNDIYLNSVNFEHGMLLSPEHFLRQERYFDSSILWLLRYTTGAWGLVGAGARAEEAHRGAAGFDPVVTVANEEAYVQVTVGSCRAITPSGCIVDIRPDGAISRRFAKSELEGISVCGVYIFAVREEKEAVDGVRDSFNPQMQTERRRVYRLSLQPPAQCVEDSLTVARLRKSRQGAAYEKDPRYIPPCVTMFAHSELAAAWRRITEESARLHERMVDLHRAMPEFLSIFRERGVDTEMDTASLTLVSAILSALQLCLHEILDPTQSPARFLQYLRRLFHFAALQIDLNPQVQGYFELLRESGEEDFVALLEAQRRTARSAVNVWNGDDDLGVEVRAVLRSLADLSRIEGALEGKYMDFRTNRSLESMNFIFERGGKALYKLAARPSRRQATEGEFIITFAQLRLEGREKYRLVLVAERSGSFEIGSKIAVEIRINEGTGFRRSPTIMSCEAKLPEQRNFEFDFDAPDVPVITDLRVVFPAHHAIRTALLYTRQRFYASVPQDRAAMELQPAPNPFKKETPVETPVPARHPASQPLENPPAQRERRLMPIVDPPEAGYSNRGDEDPGRPGEPWGSTRGANEPQPPKRRRLE